MTETAAPRRIVVVNLDESWNFAGLVRRGALDVFADPDATVEIQFRTMGTAERPPIGDKRRVIWGAERPLIYDKDLDSLTDDLIEDVDDLVAGRISDLAMIVVLADPDVGADEAAAARPKFLERLEEEIFQRATMLARPPRRWTCIRERSGGGAHPLFDLLIDALTFDPTMADRQLSDKVFRLRAPRVGDPDLEVDKRHFLALRVVVAMAVDTLPRSTVDRQQAESDARSTALSSPIGELIKSDTVFEILLPGAPAPTTSAAVARLLDGHRRAAEAAAIGIAPSVAGEDPTARSIDEIVKAIETSMLVPGQETGSASSDRVALERQTAELRAQARRWWTAEGESAVTRHNEDTLKALRAYVQRRIDEFTAHRTMLESRIATEFDAKFRRAIRSIPMVGGGQSGASAAQLERIKETVLEARRDAETKAGAARAQFMGALLPGIDAAGPQRGGLSTKIDLDLDRIDAYRQAVAAHAGIRAIYRRLVPRAYMWAHLGLVIAALVTLLAHLIGKSHAYSIDLWAALENHSAAVAFAVLIAAIVSSIWFTLSADVRRRDMVATIDDLQKRHGTLWDRVVALTDAAFIYVTVSRHILYLRLLEEEIERRRRDEDASALTIAFEDIAPHGEPPPLLAADRAAAHAQEMMAVLSTLPPVRWFRHMLELPSTFEAACPGPRALRFVVTRGSDTASPVSGASGTFQASATVFQREQIVEISLISTERMVTPRGEARASEGDAR